MPATPGSLMLELFTIATEPLQLEEIYLPIDPASVVISITAGAAIILLAVFVGLAGIWLLMLRLNRHGFGISVYGWSRARILKYRRRMQRRKQRNQYADDPVSPSPPPPPAGPPASPPPGGGVW